MSERGSGGQMKTSMTMASGSKGWASKFSESRLSGLSSCVMICSGVSAGVSFSLYSPPCRYVSTGERRSFSEQHLIDCSFDWGPHACGEGGAWGRQMRGDGEGAS